MLKLMQKSALAGAMIVSAGAALAEYPEKPIEVIVGFDAGGGTDVMARTAAPFIEKYLGEGASLVVKNVPGASGQIGITETAGGGSRRLHARHLQSARHDGPHDRPRSPPMTSTASPIWPTS